MTAQIRRLRAFLSAAAGIALLSAGVLAQDQTTKTTKTTKVELEGGKKVTVTGCIAQTPDGDFLLMDVANGNDDPEHPGYRLVTDADLSEHVGQRVEIKGQAVEEGKGKVKIESSMKKEVADAPDEEIVTRMVATSGVTEVPFLGVKSVRMLASCQ